MWVDGGAFLQLRTGCRGAVRGQGCQPRSARGVDRQPRVKDILKQGCRAARRAREGAVWSGRSC